MHKEIPILFSTPMVQAILEGRKTMTRRIVKDKTALQWLEPDMFTPEFVANPDNNLCRYGKPGDVLWVRETWCWDWLHYPERTKKYYFYKASSPENFLASGEKWKPSIHMPKAACRIYLEVTEVRAERLQDITGEDAIAEGIQFYQEEGSRPRYKDYLADASGYGHPDHDYPTVGVPVTSFATLWKKINGEASWTANPWVWVVSFKLLSTTGKPVDKMEVETLSH